MNKVDREREWTILIYAAGNNDLESYIYDSLQMLTATVGLDDMNIIVQISRFSPGETAIAGATVHHEQWHGTRLYVIKANTAILVGDLGKVDMADPKNFLNFLIWGAIRFPSRRLMLIMSGHSAGFVGMMKDHSGESSSFMGIQGFARALGLFQQSLKKKIDILLFDTCFMDMVEIWHEITIISKAAVSCVILPQDNPPLQGLPYHLVIKRLQEHYRDASSLNDLLRRILAANNQECCENHRLFTIALSKDDFLKLKVLTNRLAELILATDTNVSQLFANCLLQHDKQDFVSLPYFLDRLAAIDPQFHECSQEMQAVFDKITIYPSAIEMDKSKNVGLKMYLPSSSQIYKKFNSIYNQMLFAQGNTWAQVLLETYSCTYQS